MDSQKLCQPESSSQIQENTEKPLNLSEAAAFLNLSPGYLYKLTHKRLLPFSKPFGKRIYFDRKQLSELLKRKSVKTRAELDVMASAIVNGGAR